MFLVVTGGRIHHFTLRSSLIPSFFLLHYVFPKHYNRYPHLTCLVPKMTARTNLGFPLAVEIGL